MISKATVLVLGAGASMHLNYPSGRGLLIQVLESALVKEGGLYAQLLSHLPGNDGQRIIDEFHDALYYSGKGSVDEFLEGRPEYIEVGKLAIASVLIVYENMIGLFQKNIENWYEYLFHCMSANSLEKCADNALSIITFNYDRSLETFLFNSLQRSYGKAPEKVAEVMRCFPVIHVHGQLGDLPWQSSVGREYGEQLHFASSIQNAAQSIKIIHEAGFEDVAFEDARERLKLARQIIFLGFGYNDNNINRLMKYPQYQGSQAIFGTCFGLTQREIAGIQATFRKMPSFAAEKSPVTIKSPDLKILQFLREEINLN